MEIFIDTLRYLSNYSPLILIVILFIRRRSHFLIIDQIIIAIVVLSFTTDITLKYLIEGRNYIYILIYILIETLLFLYFFYELLKKRGILVLIMLLFFLITFVLELFFKNPVYDLFTFSLTIRCLIFIILSLYYFYQIYTLEADIFKTEAPQFWYNVGILIYFSLAFFPFLLATEILIEVFDYTLWQVHNIGNIMKNLIFATGIWMVQKR
ncbi:hypothetical protein [Marivirga sp.]|uniref:hypothetical protein n=1 Tax=Marivirga sp. TaxID=2018662 RepID=UPI0025ECBF51|nr:hypothetical protein [Marivirga sp.]